MELYAAYASLKLSRTRPFFSWSGGSPMVRLLGGGTKNEGGSRDGGTTGEGWRRRESPGAILPNSQSRRHVGHVVCVTWPRCNGGQLSRCMRVKRSVRALLSFCPMHLHVQTSHADLGVRAGHYCCTVRDSKRLSKGCDGQRYPPSGCNASE